MQVCDKRDERPALLLRCGLAVDSGLLSSKQLLAMATKREVARAFLALRMLPCVHLQPPPHRAVFTPHDIPLVRYTAWCQRKPTHTRIDHPCQNPLPSAAPDPLAGHQELLQYYVQVETILCGLQMNPMSCIERTLLQTMLKKSQYKQC